MCERRVAIEDLKQKPMNNRERSQQTGAPDMSDLFARYNQNRVIEMNSDILPNLPQRGINPSMHPWASCPMGRVTTPWCQEALVFFKSFPPYSLALA